MQRIFNVDKWQRLENERAVNFSKDEPRRVRLDVNAPDPVKLFYSDGNGETMFLARVVGRDVIEFMTTGAFSITADGGDLWFFTVDGEDYSFEIPDAVILTRIAERRPRNIEFELMQYHANRNIELRLQQMRRELDAEWRRRTEAAPAATTELAATSGSRSGSSKPASSDAVAAGATNVTPADSGSGTGGAAQ